MLKMLLGLIGLLILSCHLGTRQPAQIPQSQMLKILTLGDSLTSGIANNGGYRPHLYNLLKQAGFTVDFQGTIQEGPADMPDRDHEGHGGFRIDQIEQVAQKIIGDMKPDIILLGAGGNDIAQNFRVKSAPQRMIQLIKKIQQLSPSSIIIVQSRPPRADHLNSKVIKFNLDLEKQITNEMKHNK